MSIPTYALFVGSTAEVAYPPATLRPPHETAYQYSYQDVPGLVKRIRSALLRYAIGRLDFWKLPIAEAVIISVLVVVLADRVGALAISIVVIAGLLIASALPARVLWLTARTVPTLAEPGAIYSSLFTDEKLYWRTPFATYEVALSSLVRPREYDRVVIVGIRGSRAVCVLPEELLGARERGLLLGGSKSDVDSE